MLFGNLQLLILFLLTLGAFVIEVAAVIDCARRPEGAFLAEGKKTKKFWLILLGVAGLVGFLGLRPPLGIGFLGLSAIFVALPAFIYFADVLPAIKPHGFKKKNNNRGGW